MLRRISSRLGMATAILGLALFCSPANAQDGRSDRDRSSRAGFLQQDRLPSTAVAPMEGAVDEDEYLIGPGDVFAVTIGGAEPTVATLPVSADGRLIVPGVGGSVVAGSVLRQARADVLGAMRPMFRNVQLDVALAQPRQFYVHVSGAVPTPGRYLATPVARVSTVLEAAFADTSQSAVSNFAYRPSFRNVTLRRTDGTRRSLDLQRYLSTGDTRHNPYLQDGDVIGIGVYDPLRESVFVDGAVPFPGAYAFREGDTVLDLISIASGDNPGLSQVREVRITSRTDGVASTRSIRVSQDERPEVPLSPLDHLFVVADDALRGSATVDGWVRFPGTYPIDPGRTTLDELVEMAGGLREGVLLRGLHIERRSLPAPELHSRQINRFEFAPAERRHVMRADSMAILRNMRLSNLDFLSRAYFAQEMRLQNRVSVDPAQLEDGTASPVVLQDGDRLVVPRDEQTVYVFGQVNMPGFVTLRPGADIEDYIRAAGGRGQLADGTYVIEAGTGRHLSAREAPISSGDMIFVDRGDDIADTAELQRLIMENNRFALETERARRDARLRTTQTILSVLGTAATIVTTYWVVKNN
ncbi:MAG: SLBB domain-containing protein [Bacteroidota bacterium]